MHGEYLKLKM